MSSNEIQLIIPLSALGDVESLSAKDVAARLNSLGEADMLKREIEYLEKFVRATGQNLASVLDQDNQMTKARQLREMSDVLTNFRRNGVKLTQGQRDNLSERMQADGC